MPIIPHWSLDQVALVTQEIGAQECVGIISTVMKPYLVNELELVNLMFQNASLVGIVFRRLYTTYLLTARPYFILYNSPLIFNQLFPIVKILLFIEAVVSWTRASSQWIVNSTQATTN